LDSNKYRARLVATVHLLICFAAASGYVVSGLQPLGILFSALFVVDFPISIVYGALAFGNHAAIAFAWLGIAGTLWWYSLFRLAGRMTTALQLSAKNS
jgi:hypothetical protein